MVRGEGSLFFATRTGVRVLRLPLIACTRPAPIWWAHDVACAWTAAWMTVRGRTYLGPRELLIDPGVVREGWESIHRISGRPLGHRRTLDGMVEDGCIAVEVELAQKSKQTAGRRFCAFTATGWWDEKPTGIVYICGSEEADAPYRRADERVDVTPGDSLADRAARHDQDGRHARWKFRACWIRSPRRWCDRAGAVSRSRRRVGTDLRNAAILGPGW